jgi:type I restriction enzyme S subunit
MRSAPGGTTIKGHCASEPSEGLYPGFSASGQDVWLEAFDFDIPGIVLSAVGARCGKTFKADGAWGVVANTHCLFPVDSSRDFLWYVTNQETWWERGGSAQPFIKVADTLSRKMAFPGCAEQQAIAAFLNNETLKIDALVAEQQRLTQLLKEKRQAVISHAVTKGLNPHVPMKHSGNEWIGDLPRHWRAGPLKRYWGVMDCKHVTADFVEEGIPVASIREVQSWWVDLDHAKRTTEHFFELLVDGGRRPLPGDLIFSRNATVGEVAQVRADHPRFAMGQDVVLLRKLESNFSSDYLQHVIRSVVITEQIATMMIGSTFKRINVEEIRSLHVPWPPASEQESITRFLKSAVDRFEGLAAEARRAIDLLQERRAALISAAVTGQIDVRGLASAEAA